MNNGNPNINLREYGFSMVEIAVGVIILALVMIPAFNVISGGAKTVVSTKDQNQAVFIAQQVMERARSFPFDSLAFDHDGLSNEAKLRTFEHEMKNNPEFNSFNINGINYRVVNLDIKEIGSKFSKNKEGKKSSALISFEVEYEGKNRQKRHSLEFHSVLAKQE